MALLSERSRAETGAPATIEALPTELLVLVFLHLPPASLHTLALVCRHWHLIVHDAYAWRQLFRQRLPLGSSFQPVVYPTLWQRELLLRESLARTWTRATGKHFGYTLPDVHPDDSQHYALDFDGDRFLVYQPAHARVVSVDLRDGRHVDHLPLYGVATTNVVAALSTHAVVIGSWSGDVAAKMLSNRRYVQPVVRLDSLRVPVSAVLVGTGSGPFLAAVGTATGSIVLYHIEEGTKTATLQAGPEPIVALSSNWKDTLVAVDSLMAVHTFLLADEWHHTVLPGHTLPTTTYTAPQLLVDYAGSVAVVATPGAATVALHLLLDPELWSTYTAATPVVACASARELPHQDIGTAQYTAVVLASGTVCVFNTRAPQSSHSLQPFREFTPPMSKHQRTVPRFFSLALNAQFVALGGADGRADLYDLHSGAHVRELAQSFRKQFALATWPRHVGAITTSNVFLNPDHRATAGVALAGGRVVHYFQFGSQPIDAMEARAAARRGRRKQHGPRRGNLERRMHEMVDDMHFQELLEEERDHMMERYNGNDLSEEEQMRVALAMSESTRGGSDEELEAALALSMREGEHAESAESWENSPWDTPPTLAAPDPGDDEVDADLAEALRRSLLES